MMSSPANHQPTLYHPLSRRPEATTVTVKRLVEKVLGGEVRLPSFQRPLRWRAEDVVKLFDSIWRGYPIGSLLVWKRPARAEEIRVGGARLTVGAVDAWWLVDGQQRTTAMAAALSDLDHGYDKRWVVHFDAENDAFRSGDVPPDRVGTDVPLAILGDLRRLGRWIREHSPPDELVQRIEEAQQRILDYSIPVYVVDTEEEGALRAAFARMNSTGARMRADEVFQALLGAPSASEGARLDLDALQAACNIEGFGEPPRAEVLKAVLGMSEMDPTSRLERLRDQDVSRLVNREDAEDALRSAVEFLQKECRIPHIRLIPYPVVFVILARWFYIYPRSEPQTRQMLARWLWRGVATGVHQRAEVSKMREQVRAIHGVDEQASLDRLFAYVRGGGPSSWTLNRFNLKNARSRVEVLSLLARSPRDRSGKVSLNALISNGRVAREVFATRHLSGLDEVDSALARTAANRVMLDAKHTDLQVELARWDVEADADALASQLIDPESFEALRRRDVRTFLHRRSAAIRENVESFVDQHAAWDAPILRPRMAYFDIDEE